jgi:hypothetical protein
MTGLIRVEDVALGGAVSLVVGLLLWPRGAVQVLGTALAEAYVDAAAYLADAIHGAGASTADAVADLSQRDGPAQQDLVRGAVDMTAWFSALAASLTGRGAVPGPPAEDDRTPIAGASVATVWTADHLEAVHRMQVALVEPARAVARG